MINDLWSFSCLHYVTKVIQIQQIQKRAQIFSIKHPNPSNLLISYLFWSILFMMFLYNRMSNLSVAVLKPHYVDRTEQFDKKQIQKKPKSKRTQILLVKKEILSPHRKQIGEDHERIIQLKKWLLNLLMESKNNWQQELNAKKVLILQMKKDHKQKLMAILKHIQEIRRKAYQQFKHVCDRPKGEGCFHCSQISKYFNSSVRTYLSKQEGQNRKSKKIKKINGKQNSEFDSNNKSNQNIDKNKNFRKTQKSLKKQLRFTHSYKQTDERSNLQTLKSIDQEKRQKIKTIKSRFTRKNSLQNSKQNTIDKGSQLQIKLPNQQGQQGSEIKTGITKREQIGELRSRFRKSTQVGVNPQQNSGRRDSGNNKHDDLNRSRDSGSLRKSIVKISNGNYQEGQHPKSHFSRNIENEQPASSQAAPSNFSRKGKFGLNFNGQGVQDLIADSLRKKKTMKGRNNKYLRKNSDENAEIGLSSTELQGPAEEEVKRERAEIEQLLKEKQEMKQQHYKKITRYRRQRMFYDILKREIMKAEGIQQGNQNENQDDQMRQTQVNGSPSVTDINISRGSTASMNSTYSRVFNKYSLVQRKQSLFSKLSLLNEEKNFESLKNKIQEMLTQRGQKLVQLEKEEKMNGKNVLQKFLSEVMRTKDLKRLMKQKFMKQAVWSPQMRQMHQFYTFLEYSMQTFRSKIIKITQSNWRQLGYQGKFADSGLDNLVLDNKIGNWKGIQTANFSQEHHRQIQCSMKYYGIDVKRVKNIEHTNYQLSEDLSQNPIFSIIGQRSMKNIEELTKDFFSLY